jgi:polysaccharide transporter, PST family
MNIFNFLKPYLRQYKGLIGNLSYLSTLEVFKLILPFITIPYLLKTLGVDYYGLVAFAQAIAMYFTIIVNFGLDISAVKNISINKNNKDQLSTIVSAVLTIKTTIFVALLFLSLILFSLIPKFNEHILLYVLSLTICLSEIFCPAWFFQGIEKMKYITFIRVITYSVYTILIFLVINDKDDYYLVPLLMGFGTIVGGIFAYITIIKSEKIKISIPRLNIVMFYFKESVPFFLSRISYTVNTTISRIMAGFLLGMNDVAILDITEKVINAGKIPIITISSVLFPHIAVNKNKRFTKKAFLLTIGLGLILTLLVFLFAKYIIYIIGGNAIIEAIPILRLSSFMIILSSFTFFLGTPVLVSFGYIKPFNYSIILSTLFLLVVYSVLFFFNQFSIVIFVICSLGTELFVSIYRFYFARKYKIL